MTHAPPLTLVCFAVKQEASEFLRLHPQNSHLHCLVTGMGHSNAEHAVRQFLRQLKPDLVLSCGFAGGLLPSLNSGDVVFDTNIPALEHALLRAGAAKAQFHCAPTVAVTVADKLALRQSTSADAVEMESQPINAICKEHNIPFAIVRVVLDTANEDLPLDFNRLMTPDHRIDSLKLAGALLKAPAKIADLLRFQKQTRAAAQSLAKVLAHALT